MSDILKKLLFFSKEESILEPEVHVYDANEIENGWKATRSSVKYLACPVPGAERSTEGSPASMKNDPRKVKRTTAKGSNDGNDNSCKYDQFKSLGVLSYQVPSWRTIIDPETWCYVHRIHPCLYFTSADKKPGNLRAITFVDPAGVLDQHLGGFVQGQRTRSAFKTDFDNNYRFQNVKFNHSQLPLNDLMSLVKKKFDFWRNDIITTKASKPHMLKPLPVSTFKDNLPTSPITMKTSMTKNLPPVLLTNKYPTIDKASSRIHCEVLQSQKVKLAPFIRQPCKPAKQNKQQTKKLNWLPITAMSPCLVQKSDQPAATKPTWSKLDILPHEHPSNINIQLKPMPIQQ